MDERVRPDGRDERCLPRRRLPVASALVIGVLVVVVLVLVQRSDLAEERSRMEAAAVSERFIEVHTAGTLRVHVHWSPTGRRFR